MLSVLNGNLTVLKWESKYVISNQKYTAVYTKSCPSSLLYIQQRCIKNTFKRLRKEINYFGVIFSQKVLFQMFEKVLNRLMLSRSHKIIKPHKTKTNHIAILRQAEVYLKLLENLRNMSITTESHERNQITYLQLSSSISFNTFFD